MINTLFDFDGALNGLAKARTASGLAKAALAERMNVMKQEHGYKELEISADAADAAIDAITQEIKSAALIHYATTKVKDIHDGVNIRVVNELSYIPSHALNWCIIEMKDAVTFNKAMFEKHARAVADTIPLDFVTIVEKPQVTIATDLSSYLGEVKA